MPRQRQHEPDGIGIIVTAGEADDMDVRFTLGDSMSDELRAFDRVDHEDQIADALAPIRPHPALPGW